MDRDVIIAGVLLVPAIYFAIRLDGWPSWVLWAAVAVLGLNVLIYVWIHAIWYGLLFLFRDYF